MSIVETYWHPIRSNQEKQARCFIRRHKQDPVRLGEKGGGKNNVIFTVEGVPRLAGARFDL